MASVGCGVPRRTRHSSTSHDTAARRKQPERGQIRGDCPCRERASAPVPRPEYTYSGFWGKAKRCISGASQTFRIATRGFLYFGPCVHTNCRKYLLAPGASGEAGQGQCETWCCAGYTGCAASCRERASVPFRPRVHALDLWRQAKISDCYKGLSVPRALYVHNRPKRFVGPSGLQGKPSAAAPFVPTGWSLSSGYTCSTP